MPKPNPIWATFQFERVSPKMGEKGWVRVENALINQDEDNEDCVSLREEAW